jgi:very-short-patch-repair endonuclease
MTATQQVASRTGERLVRVDFRFPRTPVVVEVLGYRDHRTATQMARDAERTNALLADGFAPFQFTYAQIVADPTAIMSTVTSALRMAVAS